MYLTHTGPIGCTMLILWPHKYKVGQINLILKYHHNLLNSTEIPEFSYVSQYHCFTMANGKAIDVDCFICS